MYHRSTNYNATGAPISTTYFDHLYRPIVTIPYGIPNHFTDSYGPETHRERTYTSRSTYDEEPSFPRVYIPREEEARSYSANHRFPRNRQGHTYTTYTYTNSPSTSFRESNSSSGRSSDNDSSHAHRHSSFPPPHSAPSNRPAFYTYEDEEPESIAIVPAAWNSYRSEATKEELVNFFVWRGVDRDRAEREVGREFESHAPRWVGSGNGGTRMDSRAEAREAWEERGRR